MRILVLVEQMPFPLSQGQNLRLYNFARHLARNNSLTLLCYAKGSAPDAINAVFDEVEIFDKPSAEPSSSLLNKLVSSFSIDSLSPRSERVVERIETICAESQFDCILVYPGMVHMLPPVSVLPTVIDVCDDDVLMLWRAVKLSPSIREFLRNTKRLWMAWRFERHLYSRADAAILASQEDTDSFRRVCPGTPAHHVTNGVDTDFYQANGEAVDPNLIVFEGNMNFAPNVDGIVHFCENILPLVREKNPQVRLSIVGKDPAPVVAALANESVEVTGFVDDVRPYLHNAAVVICPLRKGGGVKNKVLQAWAMGKAVVASPHSTGGLAIEEGVNILVREQPSEFAKAVLELLSDPEKATAIGQNAKLTVDKAYTWSSRSTKLEDLMLSLLTEEMRVTA